ncbi:hypothetical protein C8J36_1112 [Rhizobium sp. PP-F2F-G48]|uniref:hypothetical protein n=1 Tax=Rhizobium sp. PP-F2F-G48 TaxID=2135651 RepID=UPI001052C160|nr:hypothetical protein [Rhizobium sp. PP-F2F-G48]TCM50670.1 hypothetical protein C8J36_1112 [Rhizobium sp. PP-F2F-G48]
MRRNQPNFVVEYKGGRRPRKDSTKSIWGGVDFSSFQSEIDNDLASTPSADVICCADDERSSAREQSMSQEQRIAPEAAADPHPASPDVEPLLIEGDQSDTTGHLLQPERGLREQMASAPAAHRQHGHFSDADRLSADIRHNEIYASKERPASAVPISRSQLAELDAENAVLKTHLKQRLVAEHRRLMQMLERFSN